MTIWQYVCTFVAGIAGLIVAGVILVLFLSLTVMISDRLDKIDWIQEAGGLSIVIIGIVMTILLAYIIGGNVCSKFGWCGY